MRLTPAERGALARAIEVIDQTTAKLRERSEGSNALGDEDVGIVVLTSDSDTLRGLLREDARRRNGIG